VNQIIHTAEPFFLPGNQTGCLLIHGFTGTPKEMLWMGEYLNQQGFTCLGLRLTGHATRPEDMIRSRCTDWMASVEDGYHLLRGFSERVYLIGLSMGGILALLMSARLDVRGVVAMSTPYRSPKDYPAWFMQLLSHFVRFQPKSKEQPDAGWFDKAAFAEHVSYAQNPVRSGAELQLLLAEMRAALPEVKVPVLLIHSRDDNYVSPENMEHIYAGLVHVSDKTKVYITGSGHVIPRDAAREEAFKSAEGFIRRVESRFES